MGPPLRKRLKKQQSSPDLEEQAMLRQGATTHALQDRVEALLRRVSPRYDDQAAQDLEALARQIRSELVEGAYEQEEYRLVSRVCLARPAKAAATLLDEDRLRMPKSVSAVGSWLLRTCIQGHVTLDLLVTMPSVTSKDYLNGRYFEKRARYSAAVARLLSRKKGFVVTLADFEGDARKPIVVVRTEGGGHAVRILPCVDEEAFGAVAHKLGPRGNCVRGSDGSCEIPTPRYNDALLRDCSYASRHVRIMHEEMTRSRTSCLGDTIVLAKAWLQSNGNYPRVDGFSESLVELLTLHVYLKISRRGDEATSALRLFRAVLELLVSWSQPIEFVAAGDDQKECPPLSDFASHFDVVFLDRGARVNLAARVSRAALHELKADAAQALSALRLDAPDDAFDSAFPKRGRPAWSRYDAVIRVPLKPIGGDEEETAWGAFPSAEALGEPLAEAVARRAAIVVAVALEGRIVGDVARPSVEEPTAFAERPLSAAADEASSVVGHVAIGVRFRNDDETLKAALRGPRTEDTDRAKRFREFWGPKATLRRFRDGAVVEAVVWEGEGQDWKHAIPERAVRYALARHMPERCSDDARRRAPEETRADLAKATFLGRSASLASALCVAEGSAVPVATAALERLATELRGASKGDMPLRVDFVTPASPLLRYTAPLGLSANPLLFPARKSNVAYNGAVSVVDAIVRFEESAKWSALAESPSAVQAATRALVTRTASALLKVPEIRYVGFCPGGGSSSKDDNDDSSLASPPHLRIVYAGFAFRLTPFAPGRARSIELTPRTSFTPLDSINPAREPPALREIAFVHHSLIRALSARHKVYGATVRLVSRWFHAQLFSGHVSHEAIELIVAASFASSSSSSHSAPDSLGPPASPINGFLRTMRLLWSRDWRRSPLWIDLRRATSDDDDKMMFSSPLAWRLNGENKKSESPLRILADYFEEPTTPDQDARVRSFLRLDSTPETPVFRLMQGVARDTEREMGAALIAATVAEDRFDVDSAFGRKGGAAAKRSFDAWFVIRKEVVTRGALRVDDLDAATKARAMGPKACRVRERRAYANLSGPIDARSDAPKAFIGTDLVVDFVGALRDAYGHHALFFFNALEPSVVGVAWRPKKTKKFAAMRSAYSQPTPREEDSSPLVLVPNYAEILHDCAKLGEHLVESTHLKTS